MLLQRSGENLALLKKELEKLILYLGAKKRIDYSTVEKIVPENAESSIFLLVDELGRKKGVSAINHLMKMRRQNEPPLRILAMIARHFRLLYHAGLLLQQGVPAAKLSASLQVPPFVTYKLLEQLPNFPGNSLPRIIALFKEIDLQIKTGRLQGEEALEQLVYKLSYM
jgi:DNA polymerase-3 subunit delta